MTDIDHHTPVFHHLILQQIKQVDNGTTFSQTICNRHLFNHIIDDALCNWYDCAGGI
jgi:hypothetical protein